MSISTYNLCINNIGPTPTNTGVPPVSATPIIRASS